MGELKKIRVRNAKASDHGLFRKLWKALLEAQFKLGGTIIPNEHNLDVAMQLFNSYVSGELDGAVLFVADVGVLMYGDMGSPVELSIGTKIAYGFGQYVAEGSRGKGVLDAMAKEAFKQLKEMGFDAMLGSTLERDSHGHEAYARVVKQSGIEVELAPDRPNFVRLKE